MNQDTNKKPITRRNFFTRGAWLLGGTVAAGGITGCEKPDVNQGKVFETPPGPGMNVDPSLVKWEQASYKDIQMDGAKNLRILPSGGVAVIGEEGFEVVDMPEYGGTAKIPTVSEPRYDLIEGPHGGFFTATRQELIFHKDASDSQGAVLLSLGGNAYITNLETDGTYIYIADMGNRLFWKVTHEGKMVANWGKKDPALNQPGLIVPSPYLELTIDSEGKLWGVNPGRHSVDLYDENLAVVRSWGFASSRTPGFCGCCNPTHLVALADGTFLTAEKGLPRVKHYSTKGELMGVVVPPTDFEVGTEAIIIAARSAEEVLVVNPVGKKLWSYRRKAV